jgi:hypothetical protein
VRIAKRLDDCADSPAERAILCEHRILHHDHGDSRGTVTMALPDSWRRPALWLLPGLGLVAVIAGVVWLASPPGRTTAERSAAAGPPTRRVVASEGRTASREEVKPFCGACHAYPPPETFPKAQWASEVVRGFEFHRLSGEDLHPPPTEAVIAYYEAHAPEALPVLPKTPTDTRPPVAFRRREAAGPRPGEPSAVSFVGLFHLSDSSRPDLLACEMGRGELLVRRAGDPDGPLAVLADRLGHPAWVEVVDLDGDGVKDLLAASLGVPMPSDEQFGCVHWLRGRPDGTFERRFLASRLGRVCDVRPADFDGDGDLDVVVAVFGWRRSGEILLLEQRPGRDGRPEFAPRTIDKRHGTIHVPVTDLNGDGRPDFIALISQEHEAVVAFLNAGGGRFTDRTLFAASHPAFGSSGIQLVDLDADGKLDVLLTNGDVYDSPLLKPYHGVSWLRNPGGDGPFEPRPLGPLYGAQRALAGDVDGDGDLDVVATSFLGEPYYGAMRKDVGADSVVLFEQAEPGRFVRHAIERENCDYASFALGDVDGDGDLDIVAGAFRDFRFAGAKPLDPSAHIPGPLVIWENLGPPQRSVESDSTGH